MIKDYSKQFQSWLTDYEDMRIDVTDDVHYDLREVIDEEYRLYNGMFKSATPEASGFNPIFIRKAMVVFRTLLQGSDVDLKSLNTRAVNLDKLRITAFIRLVLMTKLSMNDFGEDIDDFMSYMCWHGSVLTKKHKGGVDLVDFRNYITEPHEQDPQKRSHCEAHYYNYDEMFELFGESENWERVEELWEKMQKENVNRFRVLEWYTWGKVEEDSDVTKICIKFLDNNVVEKEKFSNTDEWDAEIQLEIFKCPDKWKNPMTGKEETIFPYTQGDLFKVQGRWKALGCGELLLAPSQVLNEIYNGKRKLDRQALELVLVHTGNSSGNTTQITQDTLQQISSGTVIDIGADERLDQLRLDTRPSDFDLMENKIFELMRQLVGITSQGTGEEQPASTSATQAAINKETQNTVFDYTRERFHHFMDKLFNKGGFAKFIINSIKEDEVVAISGNPAQLKELDEYLIDNAISNWLIKIKNKNGLYPTMQEIQQQKDKLRSEVKKLGGNRFINFKKELVKNLDFIVEFGTQQEAYDTKYRSDVLLSILQNPNSSLDKEKVEDALLDLQGIDSASLKKSPEQIEQEQQMAQQMQQPQMPQVPQAI